MVSTLLEFLNVALRWVHITSVVILIGGVIFALSALAPSVEAISAESRLAINRTVAARFRKFVWAATIGLFASGFYNFLTAPGHTGRYHMLFGIKMLLVAHVIAVAFLVTRSNPTPEQDARRPRLLAGTAISGLIIIFISAYLRRIF